MVEYPRVQNSLKALLLLGMGFFLYSRLTDGTLYFYISERFGWLTLAAILGLLIVGLSYGVGRAGQTADASPDEAGGHDHLDEHHSHAHSHSHAIGWGGALIVALPILFGLLTPPRPLGASALAVRELRVNSLPSALPAAVQGATAKIDTERTVLDWVLAFQDGAKSGENFAGAAADVLGFVHPGKESATGVFWVTRYVVGCCVADAVAVGLLVRWPHSQEVQADSWVRVQGRLVEEAGAAAPLIEAVSVVPVPPPNQPYLYP